MLPDASTLEWMRETVGAFRIESHFAHQHGNAQLWRVAVANEHLWLKLHARAHKWAGEVHALTHWGDPITPTLIASRPGAVLISECSGIDARHLSGVAAERMWTDAGQWLRRFHSRTNTWFGNVSAKGEALGEVSSDPTFQLTKAFAARTRQGRDSGLLDAATIEFVEEQFSSRIDSLRDARAHSTHRDFSPRNWLAAEDGRLTAVIDFEHARWDLRAADHSRPWNDDFVSNPRLMNAFYAGYGVPDDEFAAQIIALRLYSAVVSAVWAEEVGDTFYCQQNMEGIRRLIALYA